MLGGVTREGRSIHVICTTAQPVLIIITAYEPKPSKGGHQSKGAVRAMRCSIKRCPGEYEERRIVHTVRYHGQVIVIDHVPAEVCSVCGDVLLKPETVRHIESLLRMATHPASMVPLYEYV